MKNIFIILATMIATLTFNSCTNEFDCIENDTVTTEMIDANYELTENRNVGVTYEINIISNDEVSIKPIQYTIYEGNKIINWKPIVTTPTTYEYNCDRKYIASYIKANIYKIYNIDSDGTLITVFNPMNEFALYKLN